MLLLLLPLVVAMAVVVVLELERGGGVGVAGVAELDLVPELAEVFELEGFGEDPNGTGAEAADAGGLLR